MNKNLKPVPADKKKSLGKLPTDVRNKMGYAQKGKMMSRRDKLIEKQNPKSEYKKDKFGKTKLSYTEAKKGSMMKAKEGKMTDMMFRPTPEQAAKISNDPTRKARLKKLLENRIKNTKPDSSDTKQKLKDALKKLGSAASPSAAAAKTIQKLAGAQISDKEAERVRRNIPKKAKGGEMMKAKKGVMVTGKKEEDDVSKYVKSIKLPDAKDVRDVVKKKSMGGEMKKVPKKSLGGLLSGLAEKVFGKKASASKMPNVPGKMAMENGKLPIARLYQKATEQQMAKKSMGGEMKKGYGAARTSGMGLQDEDLIPGKSMDYYKDLM